MASWKEPRTITAIVAIAISVIALVQPWLIWAWKHYFRRGEVRIYPVGNIEIGYSDLGPTIGLHGTMIATERNHFVHKITLQITRCKDSATHNFEWAYFRGYQMALKDPQNVTLELASGYLLATSQPHRYNILFVDFRVQEELRAKTTKLTQDWESFCKKHQTDELEPKDIYQEFFKTPESVSAFDELRRLCYWDPGRYTVRMTVQTAMPAREFTHFGAFNITEPNSEEMRTNGLSIQSAACIGQHFTWNFVNTKYTDETS